MVRSERKSSIYFPFHHKHWWQKCTLLKYTKCSIGTFYVKNEKFKTEAQANIMYMTFRDTFAVKFQTEATGNAGRYCS